LLKKIGNVLTLGSSLLFVHSDVIPKSGDLTLVLAVLIFSFLDVLGHHVSVSDEVQDISLLAFSLLPEIFNLSSECVDTLLSDVLLLKSIILLSGLSVSALAELNVTEIKFLIFFLNPLLLVDVPADCVLLLNLFFLNLFILSSEQLVLFFEILIAVSQSFVLVKLLLVLLILLLESVVGFVVQLEILLALGLQFFDLVVLLSDVLVSLLDLLVMSDFLSLVLDLVVFKLFDFVLLVHHLLLVFE